MSDVRGRDRLDELPLGTRVRLMRGVGTLVELNFARAVVLLDRGEAPAREFTTRHGETVAIERRHRVDVAPAAEVEVVAPGGYEPTPSRDGEGVTDGPPDAPAAAGGAAGLPHTSAIMPRDHPRGV